MTTPNPKDVESEINQIFKDLSESRTWAEVDDAKQRIRQLLQDAQKQAYQDGYDAGYDTRSLEADHEIEDAQREARIDEIAYASHFVAHMNRKDAHKAIQDRLAELNPKDDKQDGGEDA